MPCCELGHDVDPGLPYLGPQPAQTMSSRTAQRLIKKRTETPLLSPLPLVCLSYNKASGLGFLSLSFTRKLALFLLEKNLFKCLFPESLAWSIGHTQPTSTLLYIDEGQDPKIAFNINIPKILHVSQ